MRIALERQELAREMAQINPYPPAARPCPGGEKPHIFGCWRTKFCGWGARRENPRHSVPGLAPGAGRAWLAAKPRRQGGMNLTDRSLGGGPVNTRIGNRHPVAKLLARLRKRLVTGE